MTSHHCNTVKRPCLLSDTVHSQSWHHVAGHKPMALLTLHGRTKANGTFDIIWQDTIKPMALSWHTITYTTVTMTCTHIVEREEGVEVCYATGQINTLLPWGFNIKPQGGWLTWCWKCVWKLLFLKPNAMSRMNGKMLSSFFFLYIYFLNIYFQGHSMWFHCLFQILYEHGFT